jgi:cytochrome d ubiquinol oxidase subunit II
MPYVLLAIILAGLVFYVVLAGADFGAGFWQLVAGGGDAGARRREHAHDAMAPVWEANHVWLIFVITVFWTCFPPAFGSIFSTLVVALFIAAMGIILRGASYALRTGTRSARETRTLDTVFALSSILTPFALGTVVGGIASRRVPVGNAAGSLWSSWLNPTSIAIGVLSVAIAAYLAAVYLAADAHRRRGGRARGVVPGARPRRGGHRRRRRRGRGPRRPLGRPRALARPREGPRPRRGHRLDPGRADHDRPRVAPRFDAARATAALAAAGMIAGWALGQSPVLLRGLTVRQAAAPNTTLVAVLVAVVAGGILLFPSLGLLFRLLLGGRLPYGGGDAQAETPEVMRPLRRRPLYARAAAALLVAGFGLVNVLDPEWAHVVGYACFLGCLVLGFPAFLPAEGLDPGGAGGAGMSESRAP